MQFLLFPPTSLKYTDAMCVASGNCWTVVSATEDVSSADIREAVPVTTRTYL